MQFHSIPVSEPAAFIAGVGAGILGYFSARAVHLEPDGCIMVGNVLAAVTTVGVGGSINLTLLDFLGAVVFRPLTAVGAPMLVRSLVA